MWLLFPPNLLVWLVMAAYGGGSIAWAAWPHTKAEEPTRTPAEARAPEDQPTGTPAAVEMLVSFWQALVDRLPHRPRKGLPAVALGFGMGLVVGGGAYLLFPASVLVFATMLPAGGAIIVWAVSSQDDRWDE